MVLHNIILIFVALFEMGYELYFICFCTFATNSPWPEPLNMLYHGRFTATVDYE